MIKAIIVDDELLSLQYLQRRLEEFQEVEIIQTFSNGTSVLKQFQSLHFNTAFLDIEMPGLNGLELAEVILEWNPTIQIVFSTAYRDYAIQAFEIQSTDYLVKPVLKERLEKTVSRVLASIQSNPIVASSTKQKPKQLFIQCFGELSVQYDEEPLKWKTTKAKELFAFFFMHLNEFVHRDTLIDSIWSNIDYSKAKVLLHTTISYLRKTLEQVGFPNILLFSNESYILELPSDSFQCDILQLKELVQDHVQPSSDTIEQFEKVVHLYKGHLFEVNDYSWVKEKSNYYSTLFLSLLQKMSDYYFKIGAIEQQINYLEKQFQYNPYSEHLLQQLMLAHHQLGNRGVAIKMYHQFTKSLVDELGIVPNSATRKLYEQIIEISEELTNSTES